MASSIVSGNAVVFTTSTGASTVTATPTWSLGSGSNRGVALVFSHEQQAANRIASTITVGGVSFTKIIAGQYGTGTSYANSEIWACNEASAGSIGANPEISIAWANPSGTSANNWQAQGVIVTVQDCDQSLANWTLTDTDAQLATSALAGDLTGFTAGSLILGSYCDQTGGVSVNCAQTGGDSTTEFTSSDVNFNGANARAVQFYASAADTTPAIRVQRNTTSGSVYQALAIVGVPDYSAGGTPTITSTSDDTPTDGSTLTLTVTNAEASQGTGGVTADGVGWTETSWADTSVAVTVALGDNKYGVNVPLVLTNNSGLSSSAYNVQIQPASGKAYVNLSGTLATEGDRITAIPDLASGDQLEISNVIGGTISDVTVNADASFSVVAGVTAFDVRVNDDTGWSVAATQYVAEPGTDANSKRGLVRALVRPLTFDIARDISA